MRKNLARSGAAASVVTVALACGLAFAGEPVPIGPAPAQLEPVPADQAQPEGTAYCEDAGWSVCGPRCLYGKLLNKWAAYGSFNCGCRGSYKFPVPPQYTYHWPGMYSQQTMTEYASPFRFPPFKDPPVDNFEPDVDQDVGPPMRHTQRAVRQVSQLVPVGPAGPQDPPRDEPVSMKIKRQYGLD